MISLPILPEIRRQRYGLASRPMGSLGNDCSPWPIRQTVPEQRPEELAAFIELDSACPVPNALRNWSLFVLRVWSRFSSVARSYGPDRWPRRLSPPSMTEACPGVAAWSRRSTTGPRAGAGTVTGRRGDRGPDRAHCAENDSWGHDCCVGALENLGYAVSDRTVGNVLKRSGIPPAPHRKPTTTWAEIAGITPHPNQEWICRIARNLTVTASTGLRSGRA